MVTIHGKNYITVAERLTKIHSELKELSITTEVLFIEPRVVIKATVITQKGTFTGISAANASKQIEKESPYEVAESSAVGRALAFAGYETTGGIASAEEIVKAQSAIEYAKDKVCPKDKGRLVISFTSTGKKFLKCENANWDAEQHKNIGCDYVDWLNPVIHSNKKEPYKGKTISVEDYENLEPEQEITL